MSSGKSTATPYKETFFIVPRHIIELPDITFAYLKVFETIFQFWNKGEACFLKNIAIKERTGVKETQIYDALNYFIKQGVMQKINKAGKRYLMPINNPIELECKKVKQESAIPDHSTEIKQWSALPDYKVDSNQVESPLYRTKKSALPDSLTIYEIKNLNKERDLNTLVDSTRSTEMTFEDFWKEYPKRVAKKKTEEIWKRRKLFTIADEIIESVIQHKKHDGEWLRGFIPNPPTFLNGDRWNDEVIESEGTKRERELLEKKLANEKRMADQDKLTKKNYEYERDKHLRSTQEALAFNKINPKPANYIPLSERLKEQK